MIFVPHSVNAWHIMLIDFYILNHPCIPGIITLGYSATILLRIFVSIFVRDIGL